MPRRLLGILIFLLVSVHLCRAQGDIVLLKVGQESISKAEFEYFFNRSTIDNAHEFLSVFVNHKLKVLHAKEIGLDTLADFKMQQDYYLYALGANERLYQQKEGEWIKLKHITCCLKQRATKNEEQKAKSYLDSMFVRLQKNDAEKEMFGQTLWLPKHYLLKEWNDELDKLKQKEVSASFSSPIGWHVIWWEDKQHFEKASMNTMRNEHNEVLSMRVKELNEALLVATLTNLNNMTYTEHELESFFVRNRSEYDWNLPHYQGAVFHCKNKKIAKTIKKILKRYDSQNWEKILSNKNKDLYESCMMESGLFQIGKNKYIDKLVFKCGSFEPLIDYPYTFVMGEKMKRPKSYQDVREKVLEDYLAWQEERRNDVLKQKYKVEISEEVLKTVNNGGDI